MISRDADVRCPQSFLCIPPPLELLILSCELCFLNMQEQGKKVAYSSTPFNTGVLFNWF